MKPAIKNEPKTRHFIQFSAETDSITQGNEELPALKNARNKNQNIEKTIYSIEHRMKDILKNRPDHKDTSESFSSIEKEIADVLTIMKTCPNSTRKTPTTSPKVTSRYLS